MCSNTAQMVQQIAHYELDLGLIEGDCQHPDMDRAATG